MNALERAASRERWLRFEVREVGRRVDDVRQRQTVTEGAVGRLDRHVDEIASQVEEVAYDARRASDEARGARGPGYLQLDLRAGYRFQFGSRTLDAFVDVLNVTDRSNFVNPEGDRRLNTFLVVTGLQGNGPTRTAQLGMRLAF